VADAAGFTPAIDELRALATTPDWVTEDADAHLLSGLRRGAGMPPDSTGYATHGHSIRLRVALQRPSERGARRSP
jgi:hypothetical protein